MRGPLSLRVGCEWRKVVRDASDELIIAPAGFVRYRQQMAAAGQPVAFRLPEHSSAAVRLLIRFGCIGAAATSGRFAAGGIVTSSNPLLCGNLSPWWGFTGKQNADGILREAAGPGLVAECESLPSIGPEGEKLLPGDARATAAHQLAADSMIHALAPTSHRSANGEKVLRRTYERCLMLADERELPCLALPAIGCGVNAFPPSVGARAAMDAVERSLAGPTPAVARGATMLVEFVLADEGCYAAYADAAHARWGKS